MYEMLAGRIPFCFNEDDRIQSVERKLFENHKKALPPSISLFRKATYESANPSKAYEKDYPEWLEHVIFRCLEKDTKDRFANGKELHEYVKAQMQQTSLLNSGEYRKIEKANVDLTHKLGKFSDENTQLNAHINALAKQLGTATSELEKTKKQTQKLEQENEKLKLASSHTNTIDDELVHDLEERLNEVWERNGILSHENNRLQEQKKWNNVWKILTVVFILSTIGVVFFAGKLSDFWGMTNAIDTSNYEVTISQQKTEIENLQNQNTTLQNDLKSAQLKGENTTVFAQKIKKLESEKATLQIQVEKANDDLRTANITVSKLRSQSKPADNSAVIVEKDKTIKNLQTENIKLKSEIASKEKEIGALKKQM